MPLTKEVFKQKMREGKQKARLNRMAQASPEVSKSNGNGQHPAEPTLLEKQVEKENEKSKRPVVIIPSMISGAFQHSQGTQAVDYIVKPGDDIIDLLMRTRFISPRHVRALARHIAKCRKFGNKAAEDEALSVVAGDVSVMGMSRQELIHAITGSESRKIDMEKGSSDFKKKVKDYVFPKKNEGNGE